MSEEADAGALANHFLSFQSVGVGEHEQSLRVCGMITVAGREEATVGYMLDTVCYRNRFSRG